MPINYRLVALCLFLIVSAYLLLSPYFFAKGGVLVSYMEGGNKCDNVDAGGRITTIERTAIRNLDDLNAFLKFVKNGEYYSIVVNGGPGGCTAIADGDLGFKAVDAPSGSLRFGMDIQGGIKATVKPTTEPAVVGTGKIIEIIKRRIEVLKLQEASVHASGSWIEILSPDGAEIGNLISPEMFEAKIEQSVKLDGDIGMLTVGVERHEIKRDGSTLTAGEAAAGINESFYLDRIRFDVVNVTNESATVGALVFTNDDVIGIVGSPYVKYDQQTKMYQFAVFVYLEKNASTRFANITNGLGTTYIGTSPILSGTLKYYLDGKEISRLNIPFDSAGKALDTISITGFAKTFDEASTLERGVELSLAGDMPVQLEVAKTEVIKPAIGLPALMAVFCVLAVIPPLSVHLAGRRIKNSAVSLSLSASVLLCVFGLVSLIQSAFRPGWVFDLASFAGVACYTILALFQFAVCAGKDGKNKNLMRVKILLYACSFVALFTPYRGFGLALISSLLVNDLLAYPIYVKYLNG